MQKENIYGRGINDANYTTRECPYYKRWHSMLMRCFCPKYLRTHPTYVGTSVCEDWLTFSKFKRWMSAQDWKGKQLDKDIIRRGNTHYCPEYCCFIPQKVNTLFNYNGAKGNTYGTGVSIVPSGRFVARLNKHPKKLHLGTFDTLKEAQNAYHQAKAMALLQLAKEFSGEIKQGLIGHAKYHSSACL